MGKRAMVDGAPGAKQKLKVSSQHDHHPPDSVFASAAPPKFNHASGSRTMLSFGAAGGVDKSGNSFFQSFDHEEIGGDYLDEYFSQPEKKKRLSEDQVQFLERSFETENKLEPERRVQLAKELGLQPRQIAIWFQNRRARWKTRQLETDYETLHTSFKSLKTDHDNLMKENEMLKTEVLRLRHNGFPKDTNELSETIPKEVMADMISEDDEAKLSGVVSKNYEQSLAKSDSTDGINSFLLESGDSSQFLEPDRSDLSHNGEDNFKENLFQLDHIFPKNEDARCHPTPGSFYYGFPVEDHASDFWSY